MNIETVIDIYLVTCTGLIFFSLAVYSVRERRRKKLPRQSQEILLYIQDALEALRDGVKWSAEDHHQWLYSRLRNRQQLVAFDHAIQSLQVEDAAPVQQFLANVRPVFVSLCKEYRDKGDMLTAYYAYLLGLYFQGMKEIPQPVIDFLMPLVRSNSLYCRQNALEALYGYKDAELVAKAISDLNLYAPNYDAKIVGDGLASFAGEVSTLSRLLWEEYGVFFDNIRVAFINYLRHRDGSWCERVFGELQNQRRDREVRFACMRYLGRYPYPPAKPMLVQLLAAHGDSQTHWEFAAVAANVLASYPGPETVQELKKALYSPHWHVRHNASASLHAMGVGHLELTDVLNGRDRYAREIVQYHIQLGEPVDRNAAKAEAIVLDQQDIKEALLR